MQSPANKKFVKTKGESTLLYTLFRGKGALKSMPTDGLILSQQLIYRTQPIKTSYKKLKMNLQFGVLYMLIFFDKNDPILNNLAIFIIFPMIKKPKESTRSDLPFYSR